LLVTAGVLGCSPGGAPAPAIAGATTPFVRVVNPFPVADATGTAYRYPFLGGFNNPRPQLVDIDGDGDLDLFVQEVTGAMMYFERTGATIPRYEQRSDAWLGLDVGEWSRFVDADGDGDFDLFTESPYSYVRYYRNDGTRFAPRYVPAADTLRAVDGTPIDNDRQNIPQITDIDCNGKLDLLLGRLSGTVTRFESDGPDSVGVPRFRHVTDRFQDIQIIGQFGSRHGANTMIVNDLDRDGDPDILWGDYFDPGLLWLVNSGSCPHPTIGRDSVRFPPNAPLRSSGYNAPAVADVDDDGDLDLLVGVLGGAYNPMRTSRENLFYYEQLAPMTFTLRTRTFLPAIDVGSESAPAFADLDGDGDLDLVAGNKIEPDDPHSGALFWFRNDGTTRAPRFRTMGPLDVHGWYNDVPAFGDLDGDGLPDLVLGTFRDAVPYLRNVGTRGQPGFALADSQLVVLTRGSHASPALVDIDGDGDLDLFVGEGSGEINFYRNDGGRATPRFVLVSDAYEGIEAGRRSAPRFLDLDGDGDADLLIGTEAGPPLLYRNLGSATRPRFRRDPGFVLPLPPLSVPVGADLDGDGDPDLVVGTVSGGLLFYEYRRPTPRAGAANQPGGTP
jgi:hypothetical protein